LGAKSWARIQGYSKLIFDTPKPVLSTPKPVLRNPGKKLTWIPLQDSNFDYWYMCICIVIVAKTEFVGAKSWARIQGYSKLIFDTPKPVLSTPKPVLRNPVVEKKAVTMPAPTSTSLRR
jgi:hypothetical protein